MLNIEIHSSSSVAAPGLKERIFALFQDQPYQDEIVVTIYSTRTFDRDENIQPFIRLVNSCQAHTEEILHLLRTLSLDVEHLQLTAFYPADKQAATKQEAAA